MARGWSYPYIRVTARWPNRKCPRSGGLPSLRSHRAPAYVIGMTNCPRCGKGMEDGFLGAKNRSFRHPVIPIEELLRPSSDADRRQRSPAELVGLVPMSGLPPRPRTVLRTLNSPTPFGRRMRLAV